MRGGEGSEVGEAGRRSWGKVEGQGWEKGAYLL